MPDREKVIKGLEHCLTLDSTCPDCPYSAISNEEYLECQRQLRDDAITLLKEQSEIVLCSPTIALIKKGGSKV